MRTCKVKYMVPSLAFYFDLLKLPKPYFPTNSPNKLITLPSKDLLPGPFCSIDAVLPVNTAFITGLFWADLALL